jgi:hypothetical protein
VLVENEKSLIEDREPLSKAFIVTPNERSFEWLEAVIDKVHHDWESNANINACYSGAWGNSRCQYIHHCQPGRRLIEQTTSFDFDDLITD